MAGHQEITDRDGMDYEEMVLDDGDGADDDNNDFCEGNKPIFPALNASMATVSTSKACRCRKTIVNNR